MPYVGVLTYGEVAPTTEEISFPGGDTLWKKFVP
jgi:hypothetical protein